MFIFKHVEFEVPAHQVEMALGHLMDLGGDII